VISGIRTGPDRWRRGMDRPGRALSQKARARISIAASSSSLAQSPKLSGATPAELRQPRDDRIPEERTPGRTRTRRLHRRRSDGRIRSESPAGSLGTRVSSLATSRSIAVLAAQPSFRNGTGFGRLSLLDRAGSGSLAESAARATKEKSAFPVGWLSLRRMPCREARNLEATSRRGLDRAPLRP
jgi:hypothetical protein